MSGRRRGRPPATGKKQLTKYAVGTPKIDSVFRKVARQQTQEQVIVDSTVNNQQVINATLNQLRTNSVIRSTINNTKQAKFVINPIATGQLGVPGIFGGSDFGASFQMINDSVTNTNVLALNTNSQKQRINNPSDLIDLDPQIVQNTVQSTEERPSDVQLLSSALSDGQSAVVEMLGLNLEHLLENNPILLDLIGQPQLNFDEAINAYLNQLEKPVLQNSTIVESNTNVIVPILEENLNTDQVEMDLEAQLNKPVLDTLSFASSEDESQQNLKSPSQVTNRNTLQFKGIEQGLEDKLNKSSQLRLSQSSNSISSQQAQLQFDNYMDQFFASQSSPSQTGPYEPFLSQPLVQESTERVIDLDFDYVDLYLTNVTENVLPRIDQTINQTGAVSLVRQLPIINRYLSLPAPSPNSESRPLTRSSNQSNITRVRIRKPTGLSTIRATRLNNRRRRQLGNQSVSEIDLNSEANITTSSNGQLELIRERLRRLVSRVAANSVEMDQSSYMQVESPINLLSSSQLPSQFEFEK